MSRPHHNYDEAGRLTSIEEWLAVQQELEAGSRAAMYMADYKYGLLQWGDQSAEGAASNAALEEAYMACLAAIADSSAITWLHYACQDTRHSAQFIANAPKCLAAMLRKTKTLVDLVITPQLIITPNYEDIFFEGLAANTSLRLIEVQATGRSVSVDLELSAVFVPRLFTTNTFLTTISISCGLDPHYAEIIADIMKTNTTLTALDLSRNVIEDRGAIALAAIFATNRTLKSLYLGHNKIMDAGAVALARALVGNTSLRALGLGTYPGGKHYCYDGANFFGDEGARALADMLEHNGCLTELNLEYNNVGPEGAAAIARSLAVNKSLKILKFSDNAIGDEGGTSLAEALVLRNLVLQTLDLSTDDDRGHPNGQTGVQDAGIFDLVERATKQNTLLCTVTLPTLLASQLSMKSPWLPPELWDLIAMDFLFQFI